MLRATIFTYECVVCGCRQYLPYRITGASVSKTQYRTTKWMDLQLDDVDCQTWPEAYIVLHRLETAVLQCPHWPDCDGAWAEYIGKH